MRSYCALGLERALKLSLVRGTATSLQRWHGNSTRWCQTGVSYGQYNMDRDVSCVGLRYTWIPPTLLWMVGVNTLSNAVATSCYLCPKGLATPYGPACRKCCLNLRINSSPKPQVAGLVVVHTRKTISNSPTMMMLFLHKRHQSQYS